MTPTPTPTNPSGATAIVSPVMALLRSRKAMTTLIMAIINLLIPFAPGLEAHRADLLTIGLIVSGVLAGVLVNSIAVEDASKPAPGTTTSNVSVQAETVTTPTATTSPENGAQVMTGIDRLPHR